MPGSSGRSPATGAAWRSRSAPEACRWRRPAGATGRTSCRTTRSRGRRRVRPISSSRPSPLTSASWIVAYCDGSFQPPASVQFGTANVGPQLSVYVGLATGHAAATAGDRACASTAADTTATSRTRQQHRAPRRRASLRCAACRSPASPAVPRAATFKGGTIAQARSTSGPSTTSTASGARGRRPGASDTAAWPSAPSRRGPVNEVRPIPSLRPWCRRVSPDTSSCRSSSSSRSS